MTLIVYQKKDNQVYLCGDMKMDWSVNLGTPEQIDSWRIKVIIITNKLVLAWAGELEFANRALLEIWNVGAGISYNQLKAILIRHHANCNGQTDFIISTHNGVAHKMSNGIDRDISEIPIDYIGDESLYQAYARSNGQLSALPDNGNFLISIFRTGDPDEGEANSPLSKMHAKMLSISEMYNQSTLGHVLTPVSGSLEHGFRYHLNINFDTPYVPPINSNTWETVNLGSVENGGYIYQTMPFMDGRHQLVVYENLHNTQKYIFGCFRDGVPKMNRDQTMLPI